MGKRGNGEGSIYQSTDGRWRGALTVVIEGGKQKRKTVNGKTRREVAEKLAVLLRAQREGQLVTDERQTILQYMTYWLEHHVRRSAQSSTYESYESHLRVHIGPALGRIALTKLAPQNVQAFINRLADAGVHPSTIRRIHATLRRGLNIALRRGLIARNVATLVDLPAEKRFRVTPWSPDDVKKFLAAAAGENYEAAYHLALGTGMRQGEILGLRWIDLDLDAATLTIRKSLRRVKGGGLQLFDPKTAEACGTVRLPSLAVDKLRAHRARQARQRLMAGSTWQDHGLVFTTGKGTPVEPTELYRAFQAVRESAGLSKHRFHDLRHDHASLLLALGVSMKEVQAQLRHTQIGVTANTYTHILPALAEANTAKVDDLLRGTRNA